MNKNISFTLNTSLIITFIIALLIGGVGGYALAWYTNRTDGTVAVEGYATLEVEPDQFVFSPSVSAVAPSADEARQQVDQKANALSDAVIAAGASQEQLTSNYDVYEEFKERSNDTKEWRATYSLTITVNDKELADTITKTLSGIEGLEGSLQPSSELSKSKMAEVKSQIRTQALDDARAQAKQSAQELGKSLGDVVHIEDLTGDLYISMPYAASLERDSADSAPSFIGTQEVEFRVKATFKVR